MNLSVIETPYFFDENFNGNPPPHSKECKKNHTLDIMITLQQKYLRQPFYRNTGIAVVIRDFSQCIWAMDATQQHNQNTWIESN